MQLILLAAFAAAVLVGSRLLRVHLGRDAQFEGFGRLLFIGALLVVPPIALGALTTTAADPSPLRGVGWVPVYAAVLIGLVVLMWLLALAVSGLPAGRPRRLLMLMLIGRHGDPDDVPYNPPLTPVLAGSVADVDRANRAFPRGVTFADEIERPGFRSDWAALDAATRTLEAQITQGNQLGLGVSVVATAAREDARSRLNTLRRLAIHAGKGEPVEPDLTGSPSRRSSIDTGTRSAPA